MVLVLVWSMVIGLLEGVGNKIGGLEKKVVWDCCLMNLFEIICVDFYRVFLIKF